MVSELRQLCNNGKLSAMQHIGDSDILIEKELLNKSYYQGRLDLINMIYDIINVEGDSHE